MGAIVLLGSINGRGTKILGNVVHENGIFGKQMAAFTQSMTEHGNVFFNGPRAGMNFDNGFGEENVMTSNLLFNYYYVRETGEHGPFNS